MKTIKLTEIRDKIQDLVQEANFELQDDVLAVIKNMAAKEESPAGREVFRQIIENADIADEEKLGLVPGHGAGRIFRRNGGNAEARLTDGLTACARRSPGEPSRLRGGVSPQVGRRRAPEPKEHRQQRPGVSPLGRGGRRRPQDQVHGQGRRSENMSAISDDAFGREREGIEDFVVETVSKAGPNPCPPTVVGVAVGGNFDTSLCWPKRRCCANRSAAESRSRLRRPGKTDSRTDQQTGHRTPGMGGRTTALAVHIESYPCHIASFPVAVNIKCHSHRVKEFEAVMVEIRFHGRGGQGTVVASKILADAVSKEDKWVQAYPQFGVERRGAPVFSFIRIDSGRSIVTRAGSTPRSRDRRRSDAHRGHRRHRRAEGQGR